MRFEGSCVRIVIDTNVLIKAVLSENSYCAYIFDLILLGKLESYASLDILKEMQQVIDLQYRRNRLPVAGMLLIQIFREKSIVLENIPKIKVVQEDPDDDKFFACALAAKAEYILSEDNHLLQHNPWRGIVVCRPIDFLEEFGY